jgi:hypothetical protein
MQSGQPSGVFFVCFAARITRQDDRLASFCFSLPSLPSGSLGQGLWGLHRSPQVICCNQLAPSSYWSDSLSEPQQCSGFIEGFTDGKVSGRLDCRMPQSHEGRTDLTVGRADGPES